MVKTITKRFGLTFFLSALLFFGGHTAKAHAQSPTPTLPLSRQAETPLNADIIFNLVNSTRASAKLHLLQKDERICSIAVSRGPQLQAEIFGGRMHAGFWNRNLPYWATENMIYINTEEQAVNWWLNSYIHRSAIYGSYAYGCSACVGKACSFIFTNFTPKVSTTTATFAQK